MDSFYKGGNCCRELLAQGRDKNEERIGVVLSGVERR